MGQSVSDMFYPSNPDRRARANQLKNDVEGFANEFNELKATRDKLLAEMKTKLAAFLKKQGYNTPEELDQKVQSILKGSALAEYKSYKAKYDKNSEIESAIFQITSIVSVGAGVFIGALFVLGFVTGGAAWAALGVIGGILAAFAVIMVLMAAFEGAKERANMREAIRLLSVDRVKARKALVEMKAILNWLRNIQDWLDDPLYMEYPEMLRKKLEGDFYDDFAKAEDRPVIEWLQQFDRERGAWTEEDGNWASQSYNLQQYDTDLSALKPKGVKWELVYDSIEVLHDEPTKWSKYRFSLRNLASGDIVKGFRVSNVNTIG